MNRIDDNNIHGSKKDKKGQEKDDKEYEQFL